MSRIKGNRKEEERPERQEQERPQQRAQSRQAHSVEEFTTLDVYLSAFLSINGLAPKLKRPSGDKVIFAFDKTPRLQEVIKRFYADEKISVFSFVRAVKDLRAEMHDMRGGPHG